MLCSEHKWWQRSLVIWVALLSTFASNAAAEPPPDPYRVDVSRDVSVTFMAATAWVVPPLFHLQRASCPCDAGGLNPLDRGTAGVFRAGPASVSDVMVLSAYGLGFALDALDVATTDAGVRSWLKDALVMGQTVAINGAVNELAKVVFSRPRPLLYGRPLGDPELNRGDNYASFYSEHTSGTFAIGIAYAMTYALRHPHSPFRYVLGAAALLVGGSVGALRVLSGKHFPTDLVAGAAAGATFGWLVPFLHANVHEAQLGLLPLSGGAALVVALPVL